MRIDVAIALEDDLDLNDEQHLGYYGHDFCKGCFPEAKDEYIEKYGQWAVDACLVDLKPPLPGYDWGSEYRCEMCDKVLHDGVDER